MDSAASRCSGNVYNRPSYGAVGNAVCRLWESSFYFSMGCERCFPWRNGRLCTFPLYYLFCFSAEPMLRPFHRPAAYEEAFQGNAQPAPARSCSGDWGPPPTSGFAEQNGRVCTTCLACQFCALVFMLLDSLYFPIFSQSHTIGIFEELCKMAGIHMVWFHNISETRADTRPDSFLRSGPVPPWTDRLVMSGKANYNKKAMAM